MTQVDFSFINEALNERFESLFYDLVTYKNEPHDFDFPF